jgi:hypothetical protein
VITVEGVLATWGAPNKHGHAGLLVRRDLKSALNDLSLHCRLVLLVTTRSESKLKTLLSWLDEGLQYDLIVTLRSSEQNYFNVARLYKMYQKAQSFLFVTWSATAQDERDPTHEDFGPLPYALADDELLVLAVTYLDPCV